MVVGIVKWTTDLSLVMEAPSTLLSKREVGILASFSFDLYIHLLP